MKQRLPPLKSIEAFVTTARTLSFSKAATLLNITQSAVTRRIQVLEADLGIQFFHRAKTGLSLTSHGARYLAGAGPAFDQLYQTNLTARRMSVGTNVRLRIAPSVAWAWLARNLVKFQRDLPKVNLHIESANEDGSFAIDDVDMMISFGRPETWEDLHVRHITNVTFFPVCSPSYRDEMKTPIDATCLSSLPLIGLAQIPQAWDSWLSAAQIVRAENARSIDFDNLQVGYAAAASGFGVALGSALLCEPYLSNGELVPLLPLGFPIGLAFYLIMRSTEREHRTFKIVSDWIVDSMSGWGARHELT